MVHKIFKRKLKKCLLKKNYYELGNQQKCTSYCE